MDEKKQNKTPSDDFEICCCPICSSEEFLLSEKQDVLICIHCGPVHLPIQNSVSVGKKHFNATCQPRPSLLH
ncbi:hypothetical protein [Vibrio gangliei]|uniref:hypothetical protein n=1 Tax=Vibrio gangliei TaxID=2077090 RepID=UPI000D016F0F|nr:hypothetical protein [Vibrio gangliei]